MEAAVSGEGEEGEYGGVGYVGRGWWVGVRVGGVVDEWVGRGEGGCWCADRSNGWSRRGLARSGGVAGSALPLLARRWRGEDELNEIVGGVLD